MNEKPLGFFEGTEMPNTGWWEALWPNPAKVLADCGVRPGMDVIDLCSGDGWFTYPLAQIARRVIAIDIDGALLEAAMVRLAQRGAVANVSFVEADAYEVREAVQEPMDHVFLANVFHGVPDKTRLASAVREVLKPDGLFAIVNWHARRRDETTLLGEPRGPATELRMSPETTMTAVAPSGLQLVASVEVSPYHYATVFRRSN